MNQKKVHVIDPYPIIRFGLEEILKKSQDFTLSGSFDSISEATRSFHQDQPELIILEISIQNGSAYDFISLVKETNDKVNILVYSELDEDFHAERCLAEGASGFVQKTESIEYLMDGMKEILKDNIFVSQSISNKLLQKVAGDDDSEYVSPVQKLSNRELEVYQSVGKGLNTQDIADSLKISPKTVESHLHNIKEKLRLSDSKKLTISAAKWVSNQKSNSA